MATDARVHRFTTAGFERMVETGALADLRVELLVELLTL
jgi:hypothetical protein